MRSDRLPPTNTSAGPAWRIGLRGWLFLVAMSAVHLVRLGGLVLAAWAERLVRRREGEARSRPLVFVYSQVAWDEVWQRPQEFAFALARTCDVVFFGPLQIHRRLGAPHRPYRYRQLVAAGDAEVLAVTPQTFPGTYKSGWIWRLNQLLLRCEATLACPEVPDLVVTNSPFPAWLRATLRPRRMVYDLIDDFAAFAWAPPWSRTCQEKILTSSDALVAGTRYLARQFATDARPCRYIASGVDLAPWAAAAERALEGEAAPAELAALPRPIIGYAGSISDRLDRDLIASLAREFADASLVFVGPVHGSFGGELAAPNLHFLGARSHEELPAYVSKFDVGLIPFVLNDATRALNPIKALEYLAAGCPIVATPLPDLLEEFPDVMRFAEGGNAVARAIRDVLALAPEERAAAATRGRESVAERSWERQGALYAEEMLRVIDGAARPDGEALPADAPPSTLEPGASAHFSAGGATS